MKAKAETIRIRYLYRSLVLSGRIRVPLRSARKLIGPDCAYHLYGLPSAGDKGSERRDGKRHKARTRR
ncbi:MAG: hypothetical protein JSV00_02450 [bacterium]|nr:MAG: hypothetical protein JSV00_02450 [bacterium]